MFKYADIKENEKKKMRDEQSDRKVRLVSLKVHQNLILSATVYLWVISNTMVFRYSWEVCVYTISI